MNNDQSTLQHAADWSQVMKIAIYAAAIAFAGIVGVSAPASATNWSWLSNKDYVNCLKLYASGNFQMPPGLTPAQKAAYHEKGRRYCNRTYYGHD